MATCAGRCRAPSSSPTARRTAELKWKGTLIGASEGTQVKAVAPGQVVYADWLDGFGMLLVIDHGKGYMSLYGHNQSLLRQVGQKVEQGEPVALVGDSGGQERSGLYFEIRYQGGPSTRPSGWPDAKPAFGGAPDGVRYLIPSPSPARGAGSKDSNTASFTTSPDKSLHRAGFLLGRRHHTARPDDENLPLFHPAQGKTTSPICSSSPCC